MRKFSSVRVALTLGAALLLGTQVMAAQGDVAHPVASLSASGTSALAFSSDGKWLLRADSDHNQVHILDISQPDTPNEISTVDLDGKPVALAATADYALVAVVIDQQTAFVEVIAQDAYSRVREYQVINYLDIPANPQGVTISPDNHWGLVFGPLGYSVLELIAADDMVTSPQDTSDTPVIGAALANDQAFLIREGTPKVEMLTLSAGNVPQAGSSLDLTGTPTAIAVNDAETLGAVALDDNHVVLFDPAKLTKLGTITLEDGPATHLHFIITITQTWLAVEIEGRSGVMLLNLTDIGNVPVPQVASLADNVSAMAAHADFMAAADSRSLTIFQMVEG